MDSFVDILRKPDHILVQTEDSSVRFEEKNERIIDPAGIEYSVLKGMAKVIVHPGSLKIKRIKLRWNNNNSTVEKVLNDDYDRCTNSLGWDCIRPEREMPWYFAAYDGKTTHCYGVKTGCDSFCFWQIDTYGISLWLDLRCGGNAVLLKEPLNVAVVISRKGKPDEFSFHAVKSFCKMMCDEPVLPGRPVFGVNNWYWAYGETDEKSVKRESEYLEELASEALLKPYMVIDDGWQPLRHNNHQSRYIGGPWNGSNSGFSSMEETAGDIKSRGQIPGLWFRPLLTAKKIPNDMILKRSLTEKNFGQVMDPSHPAVLEEVYMDARRIYDWGYGLIKHDFSTGDITGGTIPADGWSFYDKTKTTATIIKDFYKAIAAGSSDSLVIGCNTYGHLTAGIHPIHRSGGDTSGRSWEYTRRNGVNAFFRLTQNGTFFNTDPDCAAFTPRVSTDMNLKFLELCAITGSTTLASITPGILNSEEKRRIKEIFRIASIAGNDAYPVDWMKTSSPGEYMYKDKGYSYNWYEEYMGTRMFPTWMA